jgi:hypothetical protein
MFSFLYHSQDFYQTWLYIRVPRRVSYIKEELFALPEHLSSPPFFFVGSVLLIFLGFCVVILSVFTFWVSSCDVLYDFRTKNDVRFVFTSSYLYYLCLFVCCGVQHILCCIFFFFGLGLVCSVLPVSLIVYFWSPFRRSLNVYLIIKTSTSPRPVQSDCVCFISKGFVGVFKLIIQFVHATI